MKSKTVERMTFIVEMTIIAASRQVKARAVDSGCLSLPVSKIDNSLSLRRTTILYCWMEVSE